MFRTIIIFCLLPSVSLAGGLGGSAGRMSITATTGQSYQGGSVDRAALVDAGYGSITTDRGDKRDTSSRIGVAYHFTPRWSAELGWIDLGSNEMTLDLGTGTKSSAQIAKDVAAATPRRGSGNNYTLGVNYHQPINARFGVHAGVGMLAWNDENKVIVNGNAITSDADGTDPYIRLGIDINVAPRVSLVGNAERYYLDQPVDRLDLGVSYRF